MLLHALPARRRRVVDVLPYMLALRNSSPVAFRWMSTHGQALAQRLLPTLLHRAGPPQALLLPPAGPRCRGLVGGGELQEGSRADGLRAALRELTLSLSG